MDYDIFREELAIKYPGYGHALWEPSPPAGARYHAVQVGDVGFIRRGSFHRLFNALLPEDDESHRGSVPPHHKPLEIKMSPPTRTGTLVSNNFRSKGVLAGLEMHQSLPDQRSFSCSKERGAVLYLPVSAQREDSEALGEFGKYMTKHIDEWFTFARERGAGISRREDIVLVTGRDLARSWANVAFQDKDDRVSFEVKVFGDSHVEWKFTPEGGGGVSCNRGPSGKDLPENQCIFIRGFRATRIAMILPWLRAAAGPAQTPGEEEGLDPDTQLMSFPSDTQDPFYTLLKYIAIQAPDCDMALIHDDDLRCIDGASLDSLQPDPLMTYLRQSTPKVWQFGCDCSSTIYSDRVASTVEPLPQVTVTKVATLSNFDIAVASGPRITQNDPNIVAERSPSSDSRRNLPPGASAVVSGKLMRSIARLLPSSLEKLGDELLQMVGEMVREVESVISQYDLHSISNRVTKALDIKEVLESKSGVSKFLYAKRYHEAAKTAYRFAKRVSDRQANLSRPPGTSAAPATEDIFDRAIRVARSLYRCYLSCKDAFPSPYLKDEWAALVWNDACERTGGHPGSLPPADKFVVDSITLLTDMKTRITHPVESLYGFDTSPVPESISKNTELAQALLTDMNFIYLEPNPGGTRQYPYRHPIIQKAINLMWFQSKDGDGIVFHEHFSPIPIQVIGLALTVIECCIDEWTDGTYKTSSWNEDRYKTAYLSHIKSLTDLRDHEHPHGQGLLAQIQHDLLKEACIHAGAPFDPVTSLERPRLDALHGTVQEDHPGYPEPDISIPVTNISDAP